MGGNDTDDDPQAPALATDNEAEGSGAAGNPMQDAQVTPRDMPHAWRKASLSPALRPARSLAAEAMTARDAVYSQCGLQRSLLPATSRLQRDIKYEHLAALLEEY